MLPVIMALTDAKIRNTRRGDKPVKLTDGGGLYIEIRPNGAKLWRYRYRIAGKENIFAIGKYYNDKRGEHVSLDDARGIRDEARKLVKQGIHPAHNRQRLRVTQGADNANTFEAVAREWMGKKKANLAPSYARQIERVLGVEVFPYIGTLPIRNVTAAHLLEVMRRLEARGAESIALMVRQLSSAIFRYAVATLRADTDPAAALIGAITRPKTRHSKPLGPADIARLVKALNSYGGYPTTVIALKLALLTFVRTVELRAALWSEIDFDRAEWRIPGARMKMREAHIVPLSRQAMALLRELHALTGGHEQCWLFPNHRRPRTYMASATLNRALEYMGFSGKEGIGFSSHGFRATACTILNELGYRPDIIERQLAHQERNSVRASYNRAEYLAERRAMMQQWADYVDALATGANVVALHDNKFTP
jgi:integrase